MKIKCIKNGWLIEFQHWNEASPTVIYFEKFKDLLIWLENNAQEFNE